MNDLSSILEQRARAHPDDPMVEADGGTLTAAQLYQSVDAFATALHTLDIQRLALVARNSLQWVIADLACQKAGVCELVLPDYFSDTQLKWGIDRAGAQAVLTDDPARWQSLMAMQPIRLDVNDMCGVSLHRVTRLGSPLIPEETQKITFSSGSTGEPRGVCLTSGHQLNVARSLAAVSPVARPRHLCMLPLSTLLENIGGVYYPLLKGGTVIVPSSEETGLTGGAGLDVLKMLQVIEARQPTSMILIPQMLVALVAALSEGWRAPESVRFVAVGGGKIAPQMIRQARACGLPVFEGYGLSESGSVACLNLPGDDRPGSVGRPLAHVRLHIERGEILIRGNSFLGYLGDPGSWYPEVLRTGDLGRVDEHGYLYISGRRKNILISNFGRNISPEWIESQLMADPRLSQCVVFGDARPWCIALIAPADPGCSDTEIQESIDCTNRQLPDYARVLGWYRLARPLSPDDGLVTGNGRPLRRLIARHYSSVIESLYYAPLAATNNSH